MRKCKKKFFAYYYFFRNICIDFSESKLPTILMRKVFLKFFLLICFTLSIISSVPLKVNADEPASAVEVTSGDDYIYQKVVICDIVYIFVWTQDGKLIDIYPDGCGGPHGGH